MPRVKDVNARKTVKVKQGASKAPAKRPRMSPNGHQLPEPVPFGEIVTDLKKKQWRVGKSIGVGGFGEIYTASDDVSKNVPETATYVIKIEPHNNGPLFAEMHFYHRVCKSEQIDAWKLKKNLKFLGMPRFIASGSHELNSIKHRFVVMERFGDDLQKRLIIHGNRFSLKTTLSLSMKIIDILEYIHSTGYVHADIKASNLLLGYGKEDEVYLVDYGLACKYVQDGVHKLYSEDPRKAHDGTVEFTSRDAHAGAHSRRGDLEILGYNLVQWLAGRLPWEDNLKNLNYVHEQKKKLMENVPQLLRTAFNSNYPAFLEAYLKYVERLGFQQDPDYNHCKEIFVQALKKANLANDGKLDTGKPKQSTKKRVKGSEDDGDENNAVEVKRQPRSGVRRPCCPAETNRIRKSPKAKAKPQQAAPPPPSPPPLNDMPRPTPAMLLVMQQRQERMKAQSQPRKRPAQKKAAAKSRNQVISSGPESDDDSGDTPPKRILRSRKARSSSDTSWVADHSLTPELF